MSLPERYLNRLRAADVPDPQGDLRRLFSWAFEGVPEDQRETAEARWAMLDAAVDKRAARQPVSQIIGSRAFWRHVFQVSPDVLDPRPETETLVEAALQDPFDRVLDLGTGSGCIVISLLAERSSARGVGTDLSREALGVAADNADRLGVAGRLELVRSDWFEAIDGCFDLIVSNPPYIAAAEMDALQPEVRDWEPRGALTDEGDGLGAYRVIAAGALGYLARRGRLMVEIGPTQADAVSALLRSAGFEEIAVQSDLDGRDRVISARNPG